MDEYSIPGTEYLPFHLLHLFIYLIMYLMYRDILKEWMRFYKIYDKLYKRRSVYQSRRIPWQTVLNRNLLSDLNQYYEALSCIKGCPWYFILTHIDNTTGKLLLYLQTYFEMVNRKNGSRRWNWDVEYDNDVNKEFLHFTYLTYHLCPVSQENIVYEKTVHNGVL